MDKEGAIEAENKRHEKAIKKITLAYKIAKKVEPLLPKGWISSYSQLFSELVFSSNNSKGKDSKRPSEEFKLVCKILAKMGGYENWREAKASKETNEITELNANFSFSTDKDNPPLSVEVVQYDPDHKCEIKWEIKTYQKAIVSDACLGLGGE